MSDEEKERAFLAELSALTHKYGLMIVSYGDSEIVLMPVDASERMYVYRLSALGEVVFEKQE